MARFTVTVIVEGDYADVVRACSDVDHALMTPSPLRYGRVHDILPGPVATVEAKLPPNGIRPITLPNSPPTPG